MADRPHLERAVGVGDQPHRWTVIAANGEPISRSTENYHHEADAEHAANLTLEALLHDLDQDVVRAAVANWLTTT